jgi:threonine dehydratase
VSTLRLPGLNDIGAARERLEDLAVRTPLVRLPDPPGTERKPAIYLKLENLQPIGSFKIRGAGNAISRRRASELHDGVCTASAGNMAQGVAWCARAIGVPCRVIVPDNAPRAKTDAVLELGAEIIRLPFADWWRVLETHDTGGVPGMLVHPVEDNDVMAGNGTIAAEIVEDMPDVDTVIVPFGGGGLISGIGAGLRALRPRCRVLAAEVATAAPLRASFDAGTASRVGRTPSFVDGIGGSSVLPGMWPLVRQVVEDALVVSLDQVAGAIREIAARARVIAEGAGAAAVAAARNGAVNGGTIVCVVSGGNIDSDVLREILGGRTPA